MGKCLAGMAAGCYWSLNILVNYLQIILIKDYSLFVINNPVQGFIFSPETISLGSYENMIGINLFFFP